MNTKKILLALTLTITIGLGVTAYTNTTSATETAATTTTTISNNQRVGFGRVLGMKGYDFVESVLKNKLGMTDKQITDGLNSGKTMYDLAKEKGMTEDQFKAALLEEKNKSIDKAVTDEKITKEQGQTLKETLKNNMNNCTGTPGKNQNKGNRGNRHMSHI